MTDDLLAKEFVPRATYLPDADMTELVTRDCAVVWSRMRYSEAELGHDMETGELVAIRLFNGDYTKRRKARKT